VNALVASCSPAEGKTAGEVKPLVSKESLIDPFGSENQFEITEEMSFSDALIVAFRVLWCKKIGREGRTLALEDIPKLVDALSRSKAAGPRESVVESLLRKIDPFISEKHDGETVRAIRNCSRALVSSNSSVSRLSSLAAAK
jgi:hypothetical protein